MVKPGKTIGFGFLLIPVWFLALLLLSFIYRNEQPIDFVSANIIAAAIMMVTAFWFGRRLQLGSFSRAGVTALLWVVIVVAIMAAVAYGNQTQAIIFGQWSVYLAYLGVALGALLSVRRPKTPIPLQPNP